MSRASKPACRICVGRPTTGGGAILAVGTNSGAELLRVDESGLLVDRFAVEDEGFTSAWPAVATTGGRVFVSWARLSDADTAIYIRGYGCAP